MASACKLSHWRMAADHKVVHWGNWTPWVTEGVRFHSHCKYLRAETHKGNALVSHKRNHCPAVGPDGHWIHVSLLLQDPRKGT